MTQPFPQPMTPEQQLERTCRDLLNDCGVRCRQLELYYQVLRAHAEIIGDIEAPAPAVVALMSLVEATGAATGELANAAAALHDQFGPLLVSISLLK